MIRALYVPVCGTLPHARSFLRMARARTSIAAAIIAGLLADGARAMPPVTVPAIACQDPTAGHASMPFGSAVHADIPAALAPNLAFYADTVRRGASFAPAGWVCRINLFPDVYDIEIVPDLTTFIGFSQTPPWQQPMVSEQLLSADGALPERLSFNALGVALFPRSFPGGAGRWLGRPLHDAGHDLSASALKTLLPVGPHDVVTRKSDTLIEFMTPAGAQGLGTTGAGGGLVAPAYPVYGVAGLSHPADGSPAIIEVFEFRLPPAFEALRKPLMTLAEQQVTRDFQE
jgi:hypothetical protein